MKIFEEMAKVVIYIIPLGKRQAKCIGEYLYNNCGDPWIPESEPPQPTAFHD